MVNARSCQTGYELKQLKLHLFRYKYNIQTGNIYNIYGQRIVLQKVQYANVSVTIGAPTHKTAGIGRVYRRRCRCHPRNGAQYSKRFH